MTREYLAASHEDASDYHEWLQMWAWLSASKDRRSDHYRSCCVIPKWCSDFLINLIS